MRPLLALLLLTGCGWKTHDVVLASLATSLIATDCAVTDRLRVEHPTFVEGNPLLGRQPSGPQLWLACYGGALATVGIAELIGPHTGRTIWLAGVSGFEASVVAWNLRRYLEYRYTVARAGP